VINESRASIVKPERTPPHKSRPRKENGRPRDRVQAQVITKNVNFSISCRAALGPTQSPVQRVADALSPGVKWPRRDADHSSRVSVVMRKVWVYAFTPLHVFMA
jgi:hypothetical protein